MTEKLAIAEQFFYDHAGFGYDPKRETKEQGHVRCAKNLATAESIGREAGLSFVWEVDPDIDSSYFMPGQRKRDVYPLWQCLCYDSEGNVCQSLGGVDFGRDGSPHGDDYRRVVEAELADQQISETLEPLKG